MKRVKKFEFRPLTSEQRNTYWRYQQSAIRLRTIPYPTSEEAVWEVLAPMWGNTDPSQGVKELLETLRIQGVLFKNDSSQVCMNLEKFVEWRDLVTRMANDLFAEPQEGIVQSQGHIVSKTRTS